MLFAHKTREISSELLMQGLLIASYFDIPLLFETVKKFIEEQIGGESVNSEILQALEQLPDALQEQLVGAYVSRNGSRIMTFLQMPTTTVVPISEV